MNTDVRGSIGLVPNRRLEPRIPTHMPARLRTEDSHLYDAIISDLSRSGMQLQVENTSIAGVLPNTERELKHLPVVLYVEFEIELTGKSATIAVQFGVKHLRRITANHCTIGVEYREFLDHSEHLLACLLEIKASVERICTP